MSTSIPVQSLRVPNVSDEVAERHILEPQDLRNILQHHCDVENARHPVDQKLTPESLVIAIALFKAGLLPITDPATRRKVLDNLWVIPVAAITDPQQAVLGSLQIRKFGPSDIYAVRYKSFGSYGAPMIDEQWGTGRPLNGTTWPEVGQVIVTVTPRGGIVARESGSVDGYTDWEALPSSIAKAEVRKDVAPAHAAANNKRIKGLIGSVVAILMGDNPEEELGKGQVIMQMHDFLRKTRDGRSLATLLKAAVGNRTLRGLLIAALNRLSIDEDSGKA